MAEDTAPPSIVDAIEHILCRSYHTDQNHHHIANLIAKIASPNLRLSLATQGVLGEVAVERARQDGRWGEQNHPDGTEDGEFSRTRADFRRKVTEAHTAEGTLTWRHILDEEVHEAYAEADPAKLRVELIQVAAVATQWVEAIDRRDTNRVPESTVDTKEAAANA